MSDFVSKTKLVQRRLGVDDDGLIGPITLDAFIRVLNERDMIEPSHEQPDNAWAAGLDPRTIACIETLHEDVRDSFGRFARLAKATAATFGCDYVMISGNRSYAEQDELYDLGRSKPGKSVTKAKGGFSNHNFGIAGDFGVFRGKVYMDAAAPKIANEVHRACSAHAAACGLEWGGEWQSFEDYPHFEYATGLSMAEKRKKFKEEGSVL